MRGAISAFTTVSLPKTTTVLAVAGKKPTKASLLVRQLLSSNCRLLSVEHLPTHILVHIQFTSLEECLVETGRFARGWQANRSLKLASIGISIGETTDEPKGREFAPLARSSWLAGLAPTTAVVLGEEAAIIAKDLELLPYWLEIFGEFYNMDGGQTTRVVSLSHHELPRLAVPDGERPKHNIPPFTEFFLGREAEIEAIATLLEHNRYVRLIGASGVGKSSLAKRVGLEIVDNYRDGVKYVDLNNVSSRSEMLSRILQATGFAIDQSEGLNLETVRKQYGSKDHLLILDGCDQLSAHIEAVANTLLDTNAVQILSTTIPSGQTRHGAEFLVEDMAVPIVHGIETLSDISSIDACALLIDSIHKYRQGMPPLDEEASAIYEVCRQTGGSPLSIQLAARRLRYESLSDLLQEPHHEDKLVSQNMGVRKTLQSLPEGYRRMVEYASSLQSPWSRSDLAALMSVPPRKLAEGIEQLTNLGLVRESADSKGRNRFVLQAHFRNQILAGLSEDSRMRNIKEDHLAFMLSKTDRALSGINSINQKSHLDLLDEVVDDLSAALLHLIQDRPDPSHFIDAMRRSWLFWYKRNHLRRVINLSDAAIEKCGPDLSIQAVRLTMLKAIFLTKAGMGDKGAELLEKVRHEASLENEPYLETQVLVNLAYAYWAEDMAVESLEINRMAYARAVKLDASGLLTSAAAGAAAASISLSLIDEAKVWSQRLRIASADSEDLLDSWNIQMNQSQIDWGTQSYDQALTRLDGCLTEAKAINDPSLIGRTHLWFSQVQVSAGQFEKAAESLGVCIGYMVGNEHSLYKTNTKRISAIEHEITHAIGLQQTNQLKLIGNLSHTNWL